MKTILSLIVLIGLAMIPVCFGLALFKLGSISVFLPIILIAIIMSTW